MLEMIEGMAWSLWWEELLGHVWWKVLIKNGCFLLWQPQVDKSLFLEVFYEKYMDQMVEVLKAGCPPEPSSQGGLLSDSGKSVGRQFMKSSDRITPAEILGNICELMCFCVQHHRFRIRWGICLLPLGICAVFAESVLGMEIYGPLDQNGYLDCLSGVISHVLWTGIM